MHRSRPGLVGERLHLRGRCQAAVAALHPTALHPEAGGGPNGSASRKQEQAGLLGQGPPIPTLPASLERFGPWIPPMLTHDRKLKTTGQPLDRGAGGVGGLVLALPSCHAEQPSPAQQLRSQVGPGITPGQGPAGRPPSLPRQ